MTLSLADRTLLLRAAQPRVPSKAWKHCTPAMASLAALGLLEETPRGVRPTAAGRAQAEAIRLEVARFNGRMSRVEVAR